MNSLEALEKISWRYPNDTSFQEWCNTIKQALARLEQLENDNQLLKAELDDLKQIDIPVLKHNLEEKCEIIADLKKKNEKLKNAIDIWKRATNLDLYTQKTTDGWNFGMYLFGIGFRLTYEQYELLKEVLSNEI